ncbi:hypothetical protein GIB67_002064 [Kingdonia uniflora]|uniref:non-specific serine/threonine protein kinase n=1 Tax=Kingdonia uniflora TaxID=39325 RepID=A0A7J7KWB7_9MAGN|nr:hypothetical protein GIB67_002064 [Kingdonia uniflora]
MMEFSLMFLLFLMLCFFTINGEKTEFDFGTLTLTSLKLLGDAHLNNGTVRLTRDLPVPNSGSGRVLYSKPVRFRQRGSEITASFSTFFSFSIVNLNPSSVGGGLAFLLTSDGETVGEAGGFMGLKCIEEGLDSSKLSGSGFDSEFVGVEFDTLMDIEFNDINGNHVGLDLNSLVSAQVSDLDAIEVDLKSGNLVNAWIDYDGSNQVLNVSVSYSNLRPSNPILSFELDLGLFVSEFMFVGFSGSTQGSTEIHSVEWWSFNSNFNGVKPNGSPPPSQPSQIPTFTPSAGFSTTPLPPATATSMIPAPPVVSPLSSPMQEKTSKSSSSSCHNQLCRREPGAIAGVVTGGAFFLAIFACLLIWVFSKKFKSVKKTDYLTSEIIKTPKQFSYKELKSATRCFNSVRIVGNGAFGTVYKGIIPETGALVAVKRCSHQNRGQGKAEFLSELLIIGTLRHRNLVRLQGWCQEKGEILLVYDYMPNGSLDKALFESRFLLPWQHRRKILMGVASALAYLHQECENQVIHRDVKTSNIMLDENFNSKLGDFGLARQIEHDKSPDATVAAGTMGYLAPEYLLTGKATEKTDVFSFGAVVLEVASGRRPIERDGVGRGGVNSNLVEWVWSLHREGRLLVAADDRLGEDFDGEEMMRVLLIGLVCSHPDPNVRPTMRSVVQMLVGETEVPIVPRTKPSMSFSTSDLLLSLQDSVSDINGMMINISTSCSSSDNSFHGGQLVSRS